MIKEKVETSVIKPNLTFISNDVEYKILDSDQENPLEVAVYDVTEYVEKNNGYGKSEDIQNDLYENAQKHWKSLAETLQNTKFNFYLSQDQHKFLFDLLKNKIEYDKDTIFFAMEIADLLSQKQTWSDANQLKPFQVTATEITYVYHIIAKHKVKGLGKEAYLFVESLKRIGQISKIINYYDAGAKALSNRIQHWVAGFEDAPKFDTPEPTKEQNSSFEF